LLLPLLLLLLLLDVEMKQFDMGRVGVASCLPAGNRRLGATHWKIR
jgi:hypothetical protein